MILLKIGTCFCGDAVLDECIVIIIYQITEFRSAIVWGEDLFDNCGWFNDLMEWLCSNFRCTDGIS